MNKLDIDKVIKVFSLLKQINCSESVYAQELAKELGCKKTELMAFILDNKPLFITENDKKGLKIKNVYRNIESNPWTKEYLVKKIAENAKTLYIRQWNYYGQLGNYYVEEDVVININGPYSLRYDLWRNTKEKMERFKETKHYFESYGSTGMFSGTVLPYSLKSEHMLDLIAEGWRLEGDVPQMIKSMQGGNAK